MAWKFCRAEFLLSGNFTGGIFVARSAYFYFSNYNDVSYVFIRKYKIEQLFNIFDNLDYLRKI